MADNQSWPARVLILDDEPMIAMDLEYLLLDAGYAIACVTGKIDAALLVINSGGCDAAILDANLSGVSAAPAAAALTALGIPFLVLSGYSADQLPENMRSAPCVQKPAHPTELIDLLSGIVKARHA